MTVLDRMASTVKSDRAFLNNQRPFRLAAFFQRVTRSRTAMYSEVGLSFSPARHTFTSRNRPLSAASRPPPWRTRAPSAIDRTTSSLTKIRQLRSCAPILSITSSGIEFFCDASFCCSAHCGLGLFPLVFRNCCGVVIRAQLGLDPQLFPPALLCLFRRQVHIFRGGNFWPPCQRAFVINRRAQAARGTREGLI